MWKEWVSNLEEQKQLDPIAQRWQGYVRRAYHALGDYATAVEDFFHGVWLGHPLHGVITDVVLGSLTAGVVLDALDRGVGRQAVRKCADTAIGLGMVSGLGAAVAGATDWEHAVGATRRTGLVHAALNLTSLGLLGLSCCKRAQGRRQGAQALAWLAYGILSASAYLGGHMTYALRMGTNQAAGQRLSNAWQKALRDDELSEGEPKRVRIKDVPVMMVRYQGHIYALADTCAHMGGMLSRGTLHDGVIQCPLHGSRFKLENGHVVRGPSTYNQPVYETRINNGMIEIRQRQEARE